MLQLVGLPSPSVAAFSCTGEAGSPLVRDPDQERGKEKEPELRSDNAVTCHLSSRGGHSSGGGELCGLWLHSQVPSRRKEQVWEDSQLRGLSQGHSANDLNPFQLQPPGGFSHLGASSGWKGPRPLPWHSHRADQTTQC